MFLPLFAYFFGESNPASGLLEAGNFGTLSPWFCVDGCRLETRTDQGRNAVLVTQRDQRFDGVAQTVTASIRQDGAQNGWYQSSVSVRSPSGAPLFVWMVLEIVSSTETQYVGTPVTPILGDAWQPLRGDHHVSWTGTLVSATWRIETEPANADILVSGASLTELSVLSPAPSLDQIEVFPNRPLQTINSVVGGNFDQRSAGVNVPIDPIARFNIDSLNVNRARVMAELSLWQATPDGPIIDQGKIRQTHQMMQQLQAEGIEYVVSIHNVPDWLLLSGTEPRRIVDPAKYNDLADFLIGWVQYVQQEYDAKFTLLGFNEPDLGARLLWSPQGMADFISLAGPRFDAAGLDLQFILGDCFAIANCQNFIEPIWADPAARPYLGLVATHSWDNPQPPDAVYTAFGDFAASTNLALAITEVGWDSQMWETGIPPMDSWAHALQTANIYSKLLKLSGASTTYFWQMLGTDYPTNDGGGGFPVFSILQQFGEAIPAGAQIVETSANEDGLVSVAALVEGKLVVVLVNTGEQDRTVRVRGLADGMYDHTWSGIGALAVDLGAVQAVGDGVSVSLRGDSIHVFAQR